MTTVTSLKTCHYCLHPLQGRTDKKYCDDACRSAFHNQQRPARLGRIQQWHRQLRRNYMLLQRVSPGWGIPKDWLCQQGFDFDCITGVSTHKQRIQQYWVYDMAYRIGKNGKIDIYRPGHILQG